ncbi:MAG TPA: HAMP domain-containing sensor histidine kinase [Micromonosporaceae bacterium]
MTVVALVPIAIHVRAAARARALDEAQQRAAVVAGALAITTDPAAVKLAVATLGAGWGQRIGVSGFGIGSTGPHHVPSADIQLTASRHQPSVVDVDGGVVYLQPVDLPDGRVAITEIFVPNAELTRGVGLAWWTLGVLALSLLLFAAVADDRLAWRTNRSARRLAMAARALGDGDFTARVPVEGPRELAEAAAAFNQMADRVTAQLHAERELIADRSHRLRTPLTALRLEAERIGSTADGARLAQAVEAMEREVDHVIHTARRSPGRGPLEQEEQCDAAEVVRERMAFWAAVADDQSRPCRVYGTALRAPVPLPRGDLAAALDALLGNVFRYTPQGTAFEVEVSRREGYVAVRVDDAGPGIKDPKSALRRGASERGSTGLGLDIVRAAAVAGRGGVHIDRAAMGGTSVVVLLADATARPAIPRQRLGFVGRIAREPDERRWGRRADAARGTDLQHARITARFFSNGQVWLMSALSLLDRLSKWLRRR